MSRLRVGSSQRARAYISLFCDNWNSRKSVFQSGTLQSRFDSHVFLRRVSSFCRVKGRTGLNARRFIFRMRKFSMPEMVCEVMSICQVCAFEIMFFFQ
ncbi:hypothetical protein CEXT_249641 [Caerostris extrusa]|uniref:Uncharacterized protein n=1 Tax=Caerostris extrusa TaxID=172846 RepID=A0AAV4UHB9_CAEEX|nr:hypothetical protein CEXT_249641 [Caerostris extrusa]